MSSILRLCIFIFDTFILNYGRIWLKLDVWFARILATRTSVCVASMRENQTSNFNNSVMKLWFFVYVWETYETSSLTTWYVVHTRAWFSKVGFNFNQVFTGGYLTFWLKGFQKNRTLATALYSTIVVKLLLVCTV